MKLVIFVTLSVLLLGVHSAAVLDEGNVEFSPFLINGVRAPALPYIAFIQYFNAQSEFFAQKEVSQLISNRCRSRILRSGSTRVEQTHSDGCHKHPRLCQMDRHAGQRQQSHHA